MASEPTAEAKPERHPGFRASTRLRQAPATFPYRSLALVHRFIMAFRLDIQFVKRTEAKLGRKLPLGYVAKMCRDNGGEVAADPDQWLLYPIFDDSDRKRLKRTCNDIVHETALAREWPDFPPEALAIGNNGGGDKLVLMADPLSDHYADTVYWWDHETGEVNRVADAFEYLLGGRNRTNS